MIIDILIEDNEFESNIGGFENVAGALSMSCYLNTTHSDNSKEGEQISTYHGFLHGSEEPIFNYNIDKLQYKQNMLGNLIINHFLCFLFKLNHFF
jgi:hypothetical protein